MHVGEASQRGSKAFRRKKGGRYGWSASWESTNKENMSYRGMNIDQLFWLIGLPWGIMSG